MHSVEESQRLSGMTMNLISNWDCNIQLNAEKVIHVLALREVNLVTSRGTCDTPALNVTTCSTPSGLAARACSNSIQQFCREELLATKIMCMYI